MQFSISVLCLLTTCCGVAVAWYNKLDNNVYGGWAPHRRSPRECSSQGGTCLTSDQCCEPNAICSRDIIYGFGRCERMNEPTTSFGPVNPGVQVGTKKANELCVDSFECADQCCRLIKLGRLGYRQTCGKPRRYFCIGRRTVPKDMSNMLKNY